MGICIHDAIVVTGFRAKDIDAARVKAIGLGLTVSPIVASPINGYLTILIAPDGSKEGWDESEVGNVQRTKMIAWLDNCHGNSPIETYLQFVAVRYGADMETPPEVTGGTGFADDAEVQS